MPDQVHRAIAIVGVGAVLPDAQNAKEFWDNISAGRYSISETPVDRWDPALYYDPDPKAPDKTYSKIGGWVREFNWEPLKWRLPIPPKVAESMDRTQKWSIMSAREALMDYGYPERALDGDRTAVILGNAMAGDQHYKTALRIFFPEFTRELDGAPSFQALPEAVKTAIVDETMGRVREHFPKITEDTMPGELANIIAGRVAAVFNFHGPNFTADAACASAMAAFSAAISGLEEGDYDAVLTGGVDSNMSAPSYTKFCKIGALSATGTRPYDEGADGFVMGEGAAMFLLKRLEDAEEAGDKIYAVVRGIGGSSDGKGKGITAPNPIGQKFAIERAWAHAGEDLATVSLIEGHGTSTRVGDVVEVQSMVDAFANAGLPSSSIPIGSVKSNIGHLKGAAGAAGLLKATLALHHRTLPPSIGLKTPNPKIGFGKIPFYVNTELRPWDDFKEVRRAGVSAFGFGGTNFHAVLEEHVPGRIQSKKRGSVSVPAGSTTQTGTVAMADKVPLRGSLVLGAGSAAELAMKLDAVLEDAKAGRAPDRHAPAASDLNAPERIAIDFGDAAELAKKATGAAKGLRANNAAMWKALRAQGVFYQTGAAPKTAFLYTGQGSQYVNMLRELREVEPIVADTFREADDVMKPLLGKPLSEVIFVDPKDQAATAEADEALRQTAITQPAVLATDLALTRLLAAYGVTPDMVMGHSLGEYGALVASGALGFREALEAVSARGREMTKVSVEDNGLMAAVLAPIEEVENIVGSVDGYAVIANINSSGQSVIGGSTPGVTAAVEAITKAGFQAIPLPVSHAFHTEIVAPASGPLKKELARLGVESPKIPIVANVSGEFYPMGPNVAEEIIEILGKQIASPVQFVKGLETLYEAGARVFVEVGPKSALARFTDDVLGARQDTLALFTNHPKVGDVPAFNAALTGLYASGHGAPKSERRTPELSSSAAPLHVPAPIAAPRRAAAPPPARRATPPISSATGGDRYAQLGRLFAEFLDQGMDIYRGGNSIESTEPVVVSGATIGLPGGDKVFSDDNVDRMLHGRTFIDAIPLGLRRAIADKKITRLVKSEKGGPRFETIDSPSDVIKLAGRGGDIALSSDFGIPEDRAASMDSTTRMAIAAGVEALRDAGIPLVMHYKTTSKGTKLPDRWGLPEELQDETGVIFGSAFPGSDMFIGEVRQFCASDAQEKLLEELRSLRARVPGNGTGSPVAAELDRRIHEIEGERERDPYRFDRRFLFKALSMGHSQLAEYIGARGPNTQINSACASGTQAVSLAEDWIARGRCKRVIVVTADNVTSDNLMEWVGAGFLASGAAATDEVLEEAALPFDRRRHGLILGMGASGMVIERADSARERGLRPIAEVLGTLTANSAYHGSRLNIDHIQGLMEKLIADCEARHGIDRAQIAPHTVFVSHETYTPARGGSAQAEISALRNVFGANADSIVIANTKGMTGHAMGAGVEDATAVKILETGMVPPVANFKEVDPELGPLNLSKGGSYPVHYALRLGAGFGSQISLSLSRWVPSPDGRRPAPRELGYSTRIEDAATFERWVAHATGYAAPELEVIDRTLRVKDQGPAAGRVSGAVSVPAAVPVPAAVSVPAPVPVPVPVSDPVTVKVLEIVSAQTGYPSDMLDLELDLEADLGIDTVKQAETFAAVREAYDIEREDNLELRGFPTLGHVVQFVRDRRPDLAASVAGPASVSVPAPVPASVPAPAPAPGSVPASDPVAEKVLAIVTEQTGYPSDMLELELDLEADLGIDTVKQAETFAAVREAYDIPREDNLELREFPTLGHVIQFVRDRRPDLAVTATATGPVSTADDVVGKVLEVVGDVTGYPTEMLELDLDLEADLGIDTVKQAETFAAVREAYGIPRDDKLELRDFPTLNHVVAWVKSSMPEVAPTSPVAVEAAPTATRSADAPGDELRRVPVPVLRPPLSSCKPTGVSLERGTRVIAMLDRGAVGKALLKQLKKRDVEVLTIDDAPSTDELNAALEGWLKDGPIRGVYWLAGLDREAPIAKLSTDAWNGAVQRRAKLLYSTMRALYEQVSEPGRFLVSATRLGGKHGFDERGAVAPLGGAVGGFTKTYKREKPDATVKVVDFESKVNASTVAERLIEETLWDPGVCEVGYTGEDRWTVTASFEALPAERPLQLGRDSVFAITGAAGSIVSAIVDDLAKASGGTFHLLDLTPEPDPKDPDLQRFATDRDGLQRELFERLKQSGQKATPVAVQRLLAGLERKHAALQAIEAVRAAGGEVHYHSVNLLDKDAVGSVVDKIRKENGRIDALVHAAGLEISHFLPDKKPSEFDLVFDVKANGWYHLLSAIGDMPLGAAVVFSSIAGRFGNGGQTDYSASNELLAKSVSSFRNARPDTRGVVVDWTAWADIGMASRGSIPKMMEFAKIDMLKPANGIPVVRNELEAGTRGEVVIGGALGILMGEWDETGGLDTSALSGVRKGPMNTHILSMGVHNGLRVETVLDPKEQPFLFDHRIGGTAVLPGVMGIEGFGEITQALFPNLHIKAIEDVDFLAPFKFYRDEPRTLTLTAQFSTEGDDLVARCKLIGARTIMGKDEIKTHFSALVRLTRDPVERETSRALPPTAETTVRDEDIYQVYFHGPAYQVLDTAWRDNGMVVGRMSDRLPEDRQPPELELLTEPRLVELCFQTAGVWQIGTTGRMGLPQHIDSVTIVQSAEQAQGRLHAVVSPNEGGKSFDAYVTDEAGNLYVALRGYQTAELPEDVDPDKRKPLRAAMD